MRAIRVMALGLLLLLPGTAWAAPLRIVATTAMIGEPMARILGPEAEVTWLLGEGVDPHLHRLTRDDVARLVGADAVLWNGLHLEAQMGEMMERLAASRPVIALGETLPVEELRGWQGQAHDPHVWMDPSLWRRALANGVAELGRRFPRHQAAWTERAAPVLAEIDRLDGWIATQLAALPADNRILVTAHDAFGYFGRRYDIEVAAIQGISTESEAGLKRIAELVEMLVARRIPAVFVESSVPERHVRALIEGAAARGHKVAVGGTLYSDAMGAPGTYEGTYLGMIDHNATVLARALGGATDAGGFQGKLSGGM